MREAIQQKTEEKPPGRRPGGFCHRRGEERRLLEIDLVRTLEVQHFTGLDGGGDLKVQALENALDLGDLGGVGGGQSAGT